MKMLPGVALCAAIAGLAWTAQQVEERLLGHPYVESLVLAILLGTVVRSFGPLSASVIPGVKFCASIVLETAVFLLGASVNLGVILRAGPLLLVGIVVIVVASLVLSYGVGRAFGLSHRLALLVSCGNSICGNSAIAAVAPVIEASADDIASAIGFTAILGIAVVLLLPTLMTVTRISPLQYGVVAGLTVYAVPQVLAATLPVGAAAGAMGTLVKLVRVLLLGPTVFVLALFHRGAAAGKGLSLRRAVPWFIAGFLALAALRSTGVIPEQITSVSPKVVTLLTVLAMGALGLGVDVRALRQVGPRVASTVCVSLLVLFGMSIGLALAIRP